MMDNRDYSHFRLCYVEGETAYFTSGAMADAWGDDWNDAPYEHNAGAPYEPGARHARQGTYLPAKEWLAGGIPKWQILRVKFSDAKDEISLPFEGYNNQKHWSVEQVNSGMVPWLQVWKHSYEGGSHVVDELGAGATFPQFCEFITSHGGLVWIPLTGLEASVSPQAMPDIPLEAAA
jgi:hypothetical protein